jgi:cell division septation protein DedD
MFVVDTMHLQLHRFRHTHTKGKRNIHTGTMKLFIALLLVSTSSLITLCHGVERDLTIACGLDLNDCQSALSKAESRCAGSEPAPSPPTPTPPTAPVAPGTLAITGDDNVPPEAFPMNLCEGDCDADADCDGNLVCFQRDDGNDVPGCIGVADADGTDYCCDTSFDGCVTSEGGGDPRGGLPGFLGDIAAALDPLFDFFDMLLGIPSGRRRRNLKEGNVADSHHKHTDRKLFFGIIGRECQALLDRCEEKLAEFSCQPTVSPTISPTLSPTKSSMPSPAPNPSPSQEPTITPKPTKQPTKKPTKRPTRSPTNRPVRPPTPAPVAQMGMVMRRYRFY